MISLLLLQKIASMFLILLVSFVLVRKGLLRAVDSKAVSSLVVLLVMPCVNLAAFQIEYSDATRNGLLLALAASILLYLLCMLALRLLRPLLRLNAVEECSILFTNCINLLVPVVSSVLGQEWVVYTFPFSAVQNFVVWSYGYSRISGQKGIQLKKIFCNPNMVSLILSALLFFAGIRLPALLTDTCDMLGDTLGPLSMVVAGMLLGGMELSACKKHMHGRFWLTVALRLAVYPLLALLLLRFSPLAGLIPDGQQVLLVTLLATAAPTASIITQLAQVYGGDAEYANLLNVVTTVGCMVSIPVTAGLYLAL